MVNSFVAVCFDKLIRVSVRSPLCWEILVGDDFHSVTNFSP